MPVHCPGNRAAGPLPRRLYAGVVWAWEGGAPVLAPLRGAPG